MRRSLDALWPAALLVLFLATFRTRERESVYDETTATCDPLRTSDIGALERCLALDTQNVELVTDIGDHYAMSGDAGRAEAMYRRALAIDPRDGDVQLRLGELLLKRGDAAEARAAGEAALASQPGSLNAERLIERALRQAQGKALRQAQGDAAGKAQE